MGIYRKNQTAGFTIVELVVVIVVIAILASIATVSYSGIQSRAIKTTLDSDLNNGSQQLELTKDFDSSMYPEDPSSVNDGKGFALSGGNKYAYTSTPRQSDASPRPAYCLVLYNPKYNLLVWIDMSGTKHEMRNPTLGATICTVTKGINMPVDTMNWNVRYYVEQVSPLVITRDSDATAS